mgnify:FL=1
MKDGFHITIESLHLADRGETENVSYFGNIVVLKQRHFLYWYTCNAAIRCWLRHVGKENLVRPWRSPNERLGNSNTLFETVFSNDLPVKQKLPKTRIKDCIYCEGIVYYCVQLQCTLVRMPVKLCFMQYPVTISAVMKYSSR